MRFFICLVFCVASLHGFSQNVIEGIVKDAENGMPIPGASVYIPDLKKGSTTDVNGKFLIDNLPAGRFLVQFNFLGYGTEIRLVDVNPPTALEIMLSPSVTELTEIVISGVSHSTELKKNPIPIATLSNDVLRDNASTNIIENIAQEPGVYHISTGVAVAKPVIRGLGYNRIITIYDGIRQEGQQWGDEHGIEIDEYSVDRVEIIKGAGSLLYGSDGLGGVINFLSANPVAIGTIETVLTSNYQTNHGLISQSLVNAGNKGGFYWSGRATYKTAHAYKNAYDGYVFNSGFNEKALSLSAGLNKAWGYSQLSYNTFRQNVGLVEGTRDEAGRFTRRVFVNGVSDEIPVPDAELNNYSIGIPRQYIDHQRFSNTTNLHFREARFQLTLGYQKNVRKEHGDVMNPDRPALVFDLKTGSYNLTAHLPQISHWDISVATTGTWQQNENKGIEFLIPAYKMFDWGVVFFGKRNFNHLDLAGGIRFDHRRLSSESLYLDASGLPSSDQNETVKFRSNLLAFKNFSASAGMTYQFSEVLSLKFNTSRGFRAPNISELTSNGMHEGSLRYEYGNSALKAETSLQADLGVLINAPHVSAEVSLYQNNIRNFIYTKKLLATNGGDSIPDIENPYPAYMYTQGKATLNGGELFLDLHPHPLDWLHFENALSVVFATNKSESADSAKYLPMTPAPRWHSEIRTNAKKWKKLSNVFFKIEFEHFWTQRRVLLENRTETPTPAYSIWNIGCGFDFPTKEDRRLFSLYLTVQNLFNTAYQSHLSRLKYADENLATGRDGVFNMGRNISFKVIIPLVFNAEEKRI